LVDVPRRSVASLNVHIGGDDAQARKAACHLYCWGVRSLYPLSI
jgi:hypothetical protein